MPHVYILECADSSFYVGSTRNLQRRMEEHQSGQGSKYTGSRLPVRLAWAQEYERIDEAYAMEKRLQGWSHAKREALITHGLEGVRGWSARSRRAAA